MPAPGGGQPARAQGRERAAEGERLEAKDSRRGAEGLGRGRGQEARGTTTGHGVDGGRPFLKPDAELVQAVLAGDQRSLRSWSAVPTKSSVGISLHPPSGGAEDITQETFLRAFRGLGSYDPARPLRTWLYTIAVNVCRDWARRRGSRPSTVGWWSPAGSAWRGGAAAHEVAAQRRRSWRWKRPSCGWADYRHGHPVYMRRPQADRRNRRRASVSSRTVCFGPGASGRCWGTCWRRRRSMNERRRPEHELLDGKLGVASDCRRSRPPI